MRSASRTSLTVALLAAAALTATATERSGRRAFDGAPPTIPHEDFGLDCVACHLEGGIETEDGAISMPAPHLDVEEGAVSRCRQCHVFRAADGLFAESGFTGLSREPRSGPRAFPGAPPRIPHRLVLRGQCGACHAGETAREEIRTSHPERERCLQCHVPVETSESFSR